MRKLFPHPKKKWKDKFDRLESPTQKNICVSNKLSKCYK